MGGARARVGGALAEGGASCVRRESPRRGLGYAGRVAAFRYAGRGLRCAGLGWGRALVCTL